MSESAFRAVVAAVLVGALALAVVVTIATLYPRQSGPMPSPTIANRPSPTPEPSVTATPVAGPVFRAPGVVSVGLISRGSSSAPTLVLEFIEPRADAIPDAPGAFVVTLADHQGNDSALAFVGTPSIAAPGSLGATAVLAAPNVLLISIVASDSFNIEAMMITGLGISATSTAAIGPVAAEAAGFTGSLAMGFASAALPSPGSVTAALQGG